MMKGFEGRHRRIHPVVAIIIALFATGLVFAGYSIIHGLLQDRAETQQEALADCRSGRRNNGSPPPTPRTGPRCPQRND